MPTAPKFLAQCGVGTGKRYAMFLDVYILGRLHLWAGGHPGIGLPVGQQSCSAIEDAVSRTANLDDHALCRSLQQLESALGVQPRNITLLTRYSVLLKALGREQDAEIVLRIASGAHAPLRI